MMNMDLHGPADNEALIRVKLANDRRSMDRKSD